MLATVMARESVAPSGDKQTSARVCGEEGTYVMACVVVSVCTRACLIEDKYVFVRLCACVCACHIISHIAILS